MPAVEIRKQISMFVPIRDWKALRMEAARRKISMTELCRQWMQPHFERLHCANQPAGRDE